MIELTNPFLLKGKLVLVTGASSGIGRGTAIELSRLGARVILSGRRADALEETRSLLVDPQHHIASPMNLDKLEDIASWLASVVQDAAAPLNGFVHAAGVGPTIALRSVTPSRISEVMGPNLFAAMLLIKAASARSVVCADGASFVLVSSVNALRGRAGLTTYAASKGALISLAKSAALELARKNIRVNSILPGYVMTPMLEGMRATIGEEGFDSLAALHPLGIGTVQDIAWSAAYLLSDAARWVTGTTLTVDGGFTA